MRSCAERAQSSYVVRSQVAITISLGINTLKAINLKSGGAPTKVAKSLNLTKNSSRLSVSGINESVFHCCNHWCDDLP